LAIARSTTFDPDNGIDLMSADYSATAWTTSLDRLGDELRVLFIHGGGSLGARKDMRSEPIPCYLEREYSHFHAQNIIDTSRFDAIVAAHTRALRWFAPDVVVTHSQGGPALMALVEAKVWRGPSLLLAPAFVPGVDTLHFPSTMPICALFADQDAQVPLSVLEALVEANQSNPLTTIVITDDHEVASLLVEPIGGGGGKGGGGRRSLTELIADLWRAKDSVIGYKHSDRLPPW